MYKKNHQFHTPKDDTIIWRYLDFEKFVDILVNKSLFFCRSDKFEDPYEGILRVKGITDDEFELSQKTKKYYFLNCWHINDMQSDAMWKIFLKTNNGIAIKSSVKNLKSSLSNTEQDIHISRVYYRNFNEINFFDLSNESQNFYPNSSSGGTVNQYNYKRISFKHENELRLIHVDLPIPHAQINNSYRDPLGEMIINIDIHKLIDEIIIAPFADSWFKLLVENLLKELKLNFKVSNSNLYNF